MAGVAKEREIPKFAEISFHRWFQTRKPKNPVAPPVILWTDTFNTYFHPEVAKAAVTVLEDAGYRVILPKAKLCCGRPLYDYGMLGLAKAWLEDILTNLKEEIQVGTPLVGLEPSCLSVFREELNALLPHSIDAQRLSKQSFLLSEFLEKVAAYQPPVFQKTVFVKGHCHHSSIFKMDMEKSLLKKMKMDVQMLDVGCCGMAGAFGFEKEHYKISQQIGERILLPQVRASDPNAIIMANGFSCHEQIKQGAGRESLHLAQVIAVAITQREQEKRESEIIAS
jgi:Fe-S oxidoreductase